MPKKDDAKSILSDIGMPAAQQSDMCCHTLLALCSIAEDSDWSNAKNEWMRIYDIMQFMTASYGVNYAANTRETIRKQAIHHFRTAAIIEDNGKPTNSPNYAYRLTSEFLEMLKHYGSPDWSRLFEEFSKNYTSLVEIYASKKNMTKMPVKIDGKELTFSIGKHNELQKHILEEFAPRFAPDSDCLYVGDTAVKDLHKNTEMLKHLGFTITLHDKMPDVVLYRGDKDWLYFIEAVTSVGPMDAKRILEIEAMTENVTSGKIFVTAFMDFRTFKSFSESLAWETEVWIADLPEHMIHMNGDKFLGPR
ncbi:MAG: restriction endonuclease [Lachnospiraceae bacterium]|jgi:hypothetical protein|nr:restriction endonuclease [Lachnospiraceae bacterium]